MAGSSTLSQAEKNRMTSIAAIRATNIEDFKIVFIL